MFKQLQANRKVKGIAMMANLETPHPSILIVNTLFVLSQLSHAFFHLFRIGVSIASPPLLGKEPLFLFEKRVSVSSCCCRGLLA